MRLFERVHLILHPVEASWQNKNGSEVIKTQREDGTASETALGGELIYCQINFLLILPSVCALKTSTSYFPWPDRRDDKAT